MAPISRPLLIGLVTGLLGVLASNSHVGLEFEEWIGLDLLFKLRGTREPPADVVIVSMDDASADHFKLYKDPEKWPRSLHADLTKKLAEQGAAVIAFDIFFEDPAPGTQDEVFAEAIRGAGNVVLTERIVRMQIPMNGPDGSRKGAVNVESIIRPIEPLADSALATAPFALPKVPLKVTQYWTFKRGSGDTPTLPVVAFQIFALEAYDEFVQQVEQACSYPVQNLTDDKKTIIASGSIEQHVRLIRSTFESEHFLAERVLRDLEGSSNADGRGPRDRILKSLTRMYQGPSSRHLNYYGPPGTIRTVPYFQALPADDPMIRAGPGPDFSGKAVFVGLSERLRPQERDGFYTVFTQEGGVNISGVEIAATAFANLLEDAHVRPLRVPAHMAIVLVWGMAIGVVCALLTSVRSTLTVIALSVLYLVVCEAQFRAHGRWLPLAIPLLAQAPLVLFSTILWRYSITYRQRQNIRKAFGYFLPHDAVDELTKNSHEMKASSQIVYGVCLCTDIERYTTVADSLSPKELSALMNEYFEAVFEPVRQHGGIVSDVKGDSMLAVWATMHPDAVFRHQACLAALDIARAVSRFNLVATQRFQESFEVVQLPTRIGLDAGIISLGTIGGVNHYEYRPVGAPVNTANRIESLNKDLGTQILVSEEVLFQLDGYLTREVGEFLLKGKTKPTVVYELICRKERANEKQRTLCTSFSDALRAYRGGSWDDAIAKFAALLREDAEDGPSLFYAQLCRHYRENPPGQDWDGMISLGGN